MPSDFDVQRERIAATLRSQREQLATQERAAQEQAQAEARRQISDIEVQKQQALAGYYAEQEKSRRGVALGTPYVSQTEGIRAVEQEAKRASGSVEEGRVRVLKDISKQVSEAKTELEKWKSESLKVVEKEANKPGGEIFAGMVSSGKIPEGAIYDSYDKGTGQITYHLPDTGGEQVFVDTPLNEAIVLQTFDEMKAKGQIEANAVFQGFNKLTGDISYTVPDTRSGEEVFKDMVKAGQLPEGSKYVGYNKDTGEVEYSTELTSDDWRKLYFKQPYDIQQSYIFRQAPYLGLRRWDQLTDKEKETVLKDFSQEYRYLGQVLTMTAQEQRQEAASLVKHAAIGMIPVVGTVYNWNEMSPTMRTVSVAMDALLIGSLIYAGVSSGLFRKIATSEAGFIKVSPGLEPKISQSKLRPATVIGPSEAGMSEAQFERFRAAARTNPGLTTETFKVIERLNVAKILEQVSPTITKRLVPPSTEAAWAKALGSKPITKANVEAAIEAFYKRTPSPAEARAFYGKLLPSYAKIIAAGLPSAAVWKRQQLIWKPGVSPVPTPVTYEQAVGLTTLSPAQWSKIAKQMMPAALPAGVQQEVLANTFLGMANQAAMTAAAIALAGAKASGLTQTQAQTLAKGAYETALKSALEGATKAAEKTGTLTQTQLKTMTKLLNQTLTKTNVQTMTNLLTKTRSTTTTVTEVKKTSKTGKGNGKTKQKRKPKEKPKKKEGKEKVATTLKVPPGTWTWKDGIGWLRIEPPYSAKKPLFSFNPPEGAVNTDLRTPSQTIQIIGSKAKVPEVVSIDLGVVDIYLKKSPKPSIRFVGGGLKTIIGQRIMVPEKGMSIPSSGVIRVPSFRRKKTRRELVKSVAI